MEFRTRASDDDGDGIPDTRDASDCSFTGTDCDGNGVLDAAIFQMVRQIATRTES